MINKNHKNLISNNFASGFYRIGKGDFIVQTALMEFLDNFLKSIEARCGGTVKLA